MIKVNLMVIPILMFKLCEVKIEVLAARLEVKLCLTPPFFSEEELSLAVVAIDRKENPRSLDMRSRIVPGCNGYRLTQGASHCDAIMIRCNYMQYHSNKSRFFCLLWRQIIDGFLGPSLQTGRPLKHIWPNRRSSFVLNSANQRL